MGKFDIKQNKYYIEISKEFVEVSHMIYEAYIKDEYKTNCQNTRYYKWNKSKDYDNLVSDKYEYIASRRVESLEENYTFKEKFRMKIEKMSKRDKIILKLMLEGYTESEIGNKLNVSQQAISKRKKKIKNMF